MLVNKEQGGIIAAQPYFRRDIMLITKKEQIRIKKSIKKIQKCNGQCKQCSHAKIKTASDNRNIYYAIYCNVDENIQPLCESYKDLKMETLEALQFELV